MLSLFLYVLVSAFYITGQIISNDTLRFIFKPLIIIMLLWHYISSKENYNHLYFFVLFLCWAGDILLLFSESINFILGLICFLVAHAVYILILIRKGRTNTKRMLVSIVPFLIVSIVFLSVIYKDLGVMLAPVTFYCITIGAMGATSLYYYLQEKNTESLLFFIGAILFVISDIMIAFNRFVSPSIILSVSVMTTYVLAQYFICRSMILEKRTISLHKII